jgi:hypothetical protein
MTSSTTQAPKMTARQEMEEMVVKNCPLPPLLPAIDSEGFPVWMTKQGKDDWKAKAKQMEADQKSGKLRDPVLSGVPHALMTREQLLAEIKSLGDQRFYSLGVMAVASWEFHNNGRCGKEIDDEQERLFDLEEAQKKAGINPYLTSSAPPAK